MLGLLDRAIETGDPISYGGREEEAYCAEFAALLGGGYADGVSSGTAAVYVALRALELDPFSEVIVGAVGDPGGVMPVPLACCIPVVADAAPGTCSPGVEEVEACVTARTRAILLPHIGGEPADVAAIAELAARLGIPLIEDCAQAHGARVGGAPVGTFGRAAAFSTMYAKHFHTGGQGGVVYTRDRPTYEQVRRHADRGKPFALPEASGNVVASLNFNLDEIHAAIGRVQLRRLPAAIEARCRAAAAILQEAGQATGDVVKAPDRPSWSEPSFWFLRLRLALDRLACTPDAFVAAVAAEGIPVAGRPLLVHELPWFAEGRVFGASGYPWAAAEYPGPRGRRFACPNARASLSEHVCLALTEAWGDREVGDALESLAKVAAAYAR